MTSERRLLTILLVALASWCAVVFLLGCATTADIESVRQEFTAIKTELTGIKTGDLQLGGDGDSVTSWMYAAGSWIERIGAALGYLFALWLVYRLSVGGRFGPSVTKGERDV